MRLWENIPVLLFYVRHASTMEYHSVGNHLMGLFIVPELSIMFENRGI